MDLPATQVCYDYEDEPTQKIVSYTDKENKQVGALIINSISYPIYIGISKIGRHPQCEILLDDQSVSKYHAEIEASIQPSSAWICDLKSSNKTILNNVVLRPSRFYELKDDSVIQFGRIKAIYKSRHVENDFVIPETPGQSKHKNPAIIIPGTPDSLLSNSSVFGEDASGIAVTQSCFRKSVSSCTPAGTSLRKALRTNDENSENKQAETKNCDNKTEENKVSKDDDESNLRFSEQNERNQVLESSTGISRFSVETTQNDSTHEQNDPSTSCESDDIFEAVTQRVNIDLDLKNRRESNSSDETNIDEDAIIINNVAPTQKELSTFESSTPIKKANLENKLEKFQSIQSDIALTTKCLNARKDLLESVENNTKKSRKENASNVDDIDMLETQVVHLPNLIDTTKETKVGKEPIDINNIDMLETQIVHLPDSDLDVNNVTRNEKIHVITGIDLLDTQPIPITDTADNETYSAPKVVQKNVFDDGLTTSVEDIDYEMATTQTIEDTSTVPKKPDSKTKNSDDKKHSKINLHDSLEQKLNDMFQEVNDDNVIETSIISTQCLQNVLESSQRSSRVADTASNLVNDAFSTLIQDVQSAETNSRNSQTDSQNNERYCNSLISKKKHNIFTDSQESIDSSITISARRKNKKVSNVKATETDNNDNNDVSLTKTLPKRVIKGGQKIANSRNTVDHIEKDLLNSFEVSVHSSKKYAECAETPKSLDKRDDDILTLLPEVNIFGTLSNPATISSTSLVRKKTSTRRSINKSIDKKSDESKVPGKKPITESISDSTKDIDYENLIKMADELIATKNNETQSTKRRRANTKEKISIGSNVSTQCSTTELNNKPVGSTSGRKRKGNTTIRSKSMLTYVTRKSSRSSIESMKEVNSNTTPAIPNKKQIKKQHTNTKVSKESSSNVNDSKSDNVCDFEVGDESQEVEMIMNKSLTTMSRSTRKRKNLNASLSNESLNDSNISRKNQTNDEQYKVPMIKVKRAKFNKNNASQSSTDPISMEDPLIGNGKSNTATHVANSRSTRSKRINKDEQENKNNPSIPNKMATRNDTLMNVESAKEIMSVPLASTIRRSVSRLSTSLNSSFSAKERILFTGITDDKYIKVLKTLGGTKVEDPSRCTILVTDKIRRTTKFLSALARAVPIVSINWLEESKKSGHFLNWENYMLKDPAMEAKFGFRLRKSLDKAREQKLLEGYTVLLTPNIESPPISELKTMITSCGGKVSLRPLPKLSAKTIILSYQNDLENARRLLLKVPKNTTVQSTEFLLTGILKQELDFDQHKLI